MEFSSLDGKVEGEHIGVGFVEISREHNHLTEHNLHPRPIFHWICIICAMKHVLNGSLL